MLVLQLAIRKLLVGLVNGVTRDRCLREDLMQEAMIHFWKAECDRPGQTLSWYLQSCYFRLRHCLASGRSIDSSKRRSLQIELPEDEDLCARLEWLPVEQSVLAQVEVRECIRLLPRYLTPRERAILRCLAEGLRPGEIARQLSLSHPTVNKCRRKIAAYAIRLGLAPSAGVKSTSAVRVIRSGDVSATPQGQPYVDRGNQEKPGDRPLEQRAKNGHVQHQAAEVNGISAAAAKKIQRGRRNPEQLAPLRRESLPRVGCGRESITARNAADFVNLLAAVRQARR